MALPTKEECERISRGTCRAEFHLALAFGFGDILPDCNDLPSSSQGTCLDSLNLVALAGVLMVLFDG